MEPLNLMVSLSHFAKDGREHPHGLSEPAGRRTDDSKLLRGHRAGNGQPVRRRWRLLFAGWRTISS
ncbi:MULTISPECIES: hypothetical protein [Kribbella]|uniref:Uncharacterized protein n=1 Tax=Kribbella karoonensis TaxID=324851 RepID=A0ABN2CWD5_9ACTN